MILNGTICLDMAANTLDDICELALDNMINANVLTFDKKAFVKDAILKKHRHQYEGQKDKKEGSNMSKLPLIRSLAEIGRNHSSSKSKIFQNIFARKPVLLKIQYLKTSINCSIGKFCIQITQPLFTYRNVTWNFSHPI